MKLEAGDLILYRRSTDTTVYMVVVPISRRIPSDKDNRRVVNLSTGSIVDDSYWIKNVEKGDNPHTKILKVNMCNVIRSLHYEI